MWASLFVRWEIECGRHEDACRRPSFIYLRYIKYHTLKNREERNDTGGRRLDLSFNRTTLLHQYVHTLKRSAWFPLTTFSTYLQFHSAENLNLSSAF